MSATNGKTAGKGAALKALIRAPKILVMPAVFDAISLRVIEATGFDAAFISGAGISESRLGQPDVGIMGLEDNLAGSRALAACVDIPLFADGDTGYGNAVNVYHTVQAFERAGVAGILIEDQTWPKRCGHMAGKEVISAEEMVQKVRAAVDARRDPDFVILARTDAAGPLGIDEAVKRGQMYSDAGADLLLPDALLSQPDIDKFVKNVKIPTAINMGFGIRERGTTPLLSAKQLQDLGVAVMVLGRFVSACAIRGLLNGIAALKESIDTGKVVNRPELAVSFEELNDFMGLPAIKKLEQRYLSEEALAAKYQRK